VLAALIGVGEHGVEPLFREKEPLQRLAGVRREAEGLGAARVRDDPERLEAEGEQMAGGLFPGCSRRVISCSWSA